MGGFSPEIDLIKYQRGKEDKDPVLEEYEIEGVDMSNAMDHPRCQVLGHGWVQVLSSPCDIYLNHTAAHAREGEYERLNMMILRDHAVDVVGRMNEEGVVEGVAKIR